MTRTLMLGNYQCMLNLEKVHITEIHKYSFFKKLLQVFVWCVCISVRDGNHTQ
jgi:hypothetical protein